MLPKLLALFSTVALFCWMGFFMMGSLPLLVLKHDTPLDARFIRGLFNVYYVATISTAAMASASYALAGQAAFALGMGCVAVFAFSIRRWIIPSMDALRSMMNGSDPLTIVQFRRLHIIGMVLNVSQLGAVVWSLTKLAL